MTDKPIKATLDSSDDSVKTQKPILIQLDDIPTPEVGDAGKVLGVDDEGKYALTEGGGGGITTEIVEITAEEALDIYNGNSVEKTLTIEEVPSIFAVKSPDGSMLLCYDSVVSEGMHVYRSIADADLNLSCTYYTSNGKLYIATRNVV